LTDAAQYTLRPSLEANGVDPLPVLLLRAKNRRLPEGYKAPLEVVGQIWAHRIEQRTRERAERQRRQQQSQSQLQANAAAVAAISSSSSSPSAVAL
jgi:transcription initiation factor TFIID subunit TAF12